MHRLQHTTLQAVEAYAMCHNFGCAFVYAIDLWYCGRQRENFLGMLKFTRFSL